MVEVIIEDTLLDIVLEGLPNEYTDIKHSAEVDEDFSLKKAVITMRNMYANGVLRNGPSRKSKRRESAVASTTTSWAVLTSTPRKKPRHRVQNCFARKNSLKKSPSTARKER